MEGRQHTLAFKLRQGVRWHDGKPFTAKDVACTFDLLLGGESETKLRRNPRSAWWSNVEKVTADGDFTAPSISRRRSPRCWRCSRRATRRSIPATSRWRDAAQADRHRPVQARRVQDEREHQAGEEHRLLEEGLPYLDGIEYTIMPDRSTRMLSFVGGKFDMTFPTDVTVPLLKNISKDAPQALCTMRATGVSANLIVNREVPPFDDPRIRRALALTLDRKAFIDILDEGEGR